MPILRPAGIAGPAGSRLENASERHGGGRGFASVLSCKPATVGSRGDRADSANSVGIGDESLQLEFMPSL